jgi:hypothetical protein
MTTSKNEDGSNRRRTLGPGEFLEMLTALLGDPPGVRPGVRAAPVPPSRQRGPPPQESGALFPKIETCDDKGDEALT